MSSNWITKRGLPASGGRRSNTVALVLVVQSPWTVSSREMTPRRVWIVQIANPILSHRHTSLDSVLVLDQLALSLSSPFTSLQPLVVVLVTLDCRAWPHGRRQDRCLEANDGRSNAALLEYPSRRRASSSSPSSREGGRDRVLPVLLDTNGGGDGSKLGSEGDNRIGSIRGRLLPDAMLLSSVTGRR